MTSSGKESPTPNRGPKLATRMYLGFLLVLLLAACVHMLAGHERVWVVWLICLGVSPLLVHWILAPFRARLDALALAMRTYAAGDTSIRLTDVDHGDLTELFRLFNDLSEQARAKHDLAFQKELLLETVVTHTPMAILLIGVHDRLVLTNGEARTLFRLESQDASIRFNDLLERTDPAIASALRENRDTLVNLSEHGETETFHVSQRAFLLYTQPHRLIMVKRLTANIRRQELKVWKDIIRLINHELNNTLAPLQSLLHSARVILRQPEHGAKLERVLGTMETVTQGLHHFLEGYSQFARLPLPRLEPVVWSEFLAELGALMVFDVENHLADEASDLFDPAQIRQVLINLLKNAREASADTDAISLRLDQDPKGWTWVHVQDRGRGMTEAALEKALQPFFSTKPSGTGLGLALCRDIIESHGGTIRLQRREGGGMVVSFCLPPEFSLSLRPLS